MASSKGHSQEQSKRQNNTAETHSHNPGAASSVAQPIASFGQLNARQRNVMRMQQRVGNNAVSRMIAAGGARSAPRRQSSIVRRAEDGAPAADAQPDQNAAGQRPPTLGAATETNPDGGVRVVSVSAGSPAASTLNVNDVIKSINSVVVNSNEEFLQELQKYQAGSSVTLGVAQNGAQSNAAAPGANDASSVQPMRRVQRDPASEAGTEHPVAVQLQAQPATPDSGGGAGAVSTQTVRVVVKSHIKTIIPNIGMLPPGPQDIFPPDPLGSTRRLLGFAAATDLIMREDPPTDNLDPATSSGHYRLFSGTNLTITKTGGTVTGITATPLETDGGWEGPLKAAPLHQIVPLATNAPNQFTWGVSGMPHPAAAAPMQIIFPRTNQFIWHIITGTVDAAGHVSFSVTNSLFPSVSVYVNGVKSTVYNQGNASLLWIGGNLHSS